MTGGAASLQDPVDRLVSDFLESSAAGIHDRLGDVAGVAVSTAEGRRPRTLGASTTLAADVDRIQFRIGHGPCLAALTTGAALHVPDLGGDDRWGDYGPQAAARGAASCYSVPVFVGDACVAVFKVYAAETDGIDPDQRATADLVAKEVSGGFALAMHLGRQAADLDDLTALLTHRRVIDLALGILMERVKVPADAAFGMLTTQSQSSNVKVHELAADVVRSIPGTSSDDLVPPYSPRDEAGAAGAVVV
ncbi:GAF and ANTAR domain-containing protein [Nocardioides sp. 1609]|uniref:GAF and ANTAR domain-containing protein n=1 Tax=Nocardioides sp. 1609 TaxID=2508327 RepID=UPI00106F5DC5|nr:GAF and ANTAR domain-containing protein [Nocardioides sp. 1609]